MQEPTVPNEDIALYRKKCSRCGPAPPDLILDRGGHQTFRPLLPNLVAVDRVNGLKFLLGHQRPDFHPTQKRPLMRPRNEFERTAVAINLIESKPNSRIPAIHKWWIQIVVLVPVAFCRN